MMGVHDDDMHLTLCLSMPLLSDLLHTFLLPCVDTQSNLPSIENFLSLSYFGYLAFVSHWCYILNFLNIFLTNFHMSTHDIVPA